MQNLNAEPESAYDSQPVRSLSIVVFFPCCFLSIDNAAYAN
jgi:hypothetical protein